MKTDRMTLQQKSMAVVILERNENAPTTRDLGEATIYYAPYSGAKCAQRLYYDSAQSVVRALVKRGIVEQAGSAYGGAKTWRIAGEAVEVVRGWKARIDAMETVS
jgi:hypothetical protein